MFPRFIPRRQALGLLAWLVVWPIAWLARPNAPLIGFVLIAMTLVVLIAFRALTLIVGSAGVALGAFAIERSLFSPVVAAFIAVIAAAGFAHAAAANATDSPPALDADARALAPTARWVAVGGVLVAHGALANHRHGILQSLALAFPLVAVVLGAMAMAAFVVLRKKLARLRVRPIEDDVDAPVLFGKIAAKLDAALVEGTSHAAGPYRAGEGVVVARVPSDPGVPARRARHLMLTALGSMLVCAALGTLTFGPLARMAHRIDLPATPATLPPLIAECNAHPPKIQFAALAPLRVLDIEAIAARYRRAGVDAVVAAPLPFEDHYLDRTRGQVIGEEIASAARKAYGARKHELVIVVTDRDMFLRDVDWRYAFATREAGVAIVSIARMDPNFPLLEPASYTPRAEECTATVRARAFRMITRQVLLGLCYAETVEDPQSTRRRTVLGLSDLDAIDEGTY